MFADSLVGHFEVFAANEDIGVFIDNFKQHSKEEITHTFFSDSGITVAELRAPLLQNGKIEVRASF